MSVSCRDQSGYGLSQWESRRYLVPRTILSLSIYAPGLLCRWMIYPDDIYPTPWRYSLDTLIRTFIGINTIILFAFHHKNYIIYGKGILVPDTSYKISCLIKVVNRYPTSWSTLRWHHNERDIVSNHQPHDCLLSRLFRRRSKKTSKHRTTGLCAGNSPGTAEFPSQMASHAENVSIWWRHHVCWISALLMGQNCSNLTHLGWGTKPFPHFPYFGIFRHCQYTH